MKVTIAILCAAASTLMAASAIAQQRPTEDVQWVNQCVRDSAGYAASEQVKIMYCTCMVSRMSNNETRSVSQWEQANPKIRDECAKRAGWN